jgi:peptidoglycan/LPS O-acetylase OafA/YrhL
MDMPRMSPQALPEREGGAKRTLLFPRQNNLEWLRLIFALQVVLGHLHEHMNLDVPRFIYHFPGVPAFFFVSGFLIYSSYLNAPGFRYFQNRFLRLFPALFFVTLGGVVVTATAHGWDTILHHAGLYSVWIVAQTTIGQGYNPAYFRDIGVGVVNGSLWTLTVEIFFYTSVPIVVWSERRFRWALPVLMATSFGVYAVWTTTALHTARHQKGLLDFLALTPIVWGWMFGFGILAVRYFLFLKSMLRFAPMAILAMVPLWIWGHGFLFGSWGNEVGLIYYILYTSVVAWLAFEIPYLPLSIDFSYGTYIWHAPILNLMLILRVDSPALVIILTLLMAALSWFLVEKPALALKKKSLHPVK